MNVPAAVGHYESAHRGSRMGGPSAAPGWDLSVALAHAALDPSVPDGTFRFYTLIATAFGDHPFTTSQAVKIARQPQRTVWMLLGNCVNAGLLTSHRKIVATREGRPVRERVYRAKAVI